MRIRPLLCKITYKFIYKQIYTASGFSCIQGSLRLAPNYVLTLIAAMCRGVSPRMFLRIDLTGFEDSEAEGDLRLPRQQGRSFKVKCTNCSSASKHLTWVYKLCTFVGQAYQQHQVLVCMLIAKSYFNSCSNN